MDSLGKNWVEVDLPPNVYELFCSKNKIEVETKQSLNKLIMKVNDSFLSHM